MNFESLNHSETVSNNNTEKSSVVINAEGKLENTKAQSSNDIKEKIHSLKQEIEDYTDKLKAVALSKKQYGNEVPFSTLVDGVEVTPSIIQEKQDELAELQGPQKQKGGIRKTLRKALGTFFHL